jgi:hypothetical protein
MSSFRLAFLFVATSLLLAGVAVAQDECVITGTVTAELNIDGPDLGAWCYTLELVWDTGSDYALSHFDFLLDNPDGNCSCDDFADALAWEDPAGSSNGEPDDCTVDYALYLECEGDPSIPDVEGILLKFEPYEDDECEPGPTGTGIFVFYSDLEPAPIAEDNLFLIDKFAGFACSGEVTGVFPGLACDPVASEHRTWTGVKSLYDR